MIAKTGLLIVSNPKHISKILSSVRNQVKNTLYIQLLSALGDPLGCFHSKTFKTWPRYSRTIFNIYSQAVMHCNDLDVKVLLSGVKYNIPKIQTQKPIDLVIFDKAHNQNEIENFIKARIQNITKECNVVTLDTSDIDFVPECHENDDAIFSHTVLGGTFDRLHVAHKLLLSEAALRSKKKVTVGVTTENMLHTKLLWELIEDIDVRVKNVTDFLEDICPELNYSIVPISDPFGPAISDPSMEMIVVSEETLRGGQKINEIRQERNLPILQVVQIELIDEPDPKPMEEAKISSSTTRIRLLGTLLKPIVLNKNIPEIPYIIGLTGGIASGKTGVAGYLHDLGALIINCDKLGHEVYKQGKPCYVELLAHFGNKILSANGEIDRKLLGGLVFNDPEQMKKLNSIVWPAIADEVQKIIKTTDKKVIVIEAAVLLMAGWEKYCHEVWTTIIPRPEAIRRIVNRNSLTEKQAINRIDAQPENTFYVNNAHVVFYTLWEVEYTKDQVLRAWDLLKKRM